MIDAIKQAWQLRALRNAPRLISVLLATLMVAECVRTVLLLLGQHPAITPSPASASASASASAARKVLRPHLGLDLRPIVAAHLFGVAAEDSRDPDHASPTTANLVLQGTIATRDPTHGLAIITAADPAKVYKVGDDVEGASLHSVYLDRVILNRSGIFETLALPRFQSMAQRGTHE
ncbi:MAG TPA: type II secretion system protein N, partial [Steroidobacteraceae bacterium]